MEFTTGSKDGTELFGRHWAVDAPVAVLSLVHGFGEHCGRYDHMAAHLNANGIAVVALDLHGHGKTPGKRGVIRDYDDFRADLAALLKETKRLYPETPHILYGHSMGGAIVMDHGLVQQDGLPIIASAPLIALTDTPPKALRVIAKVLGKLSPTGAMKQPIDGTKISNFPAEQEAYMADPLNHGTLGFRLAEAMVSTGENIAVKANAWHRPLLLLHSKADQLTSFDASAAFVRDARQVSFHPFETSQHEMHNDAPRDEVYALMIDFILKFSDPKSA